MKHATGNRLRVGFLALLFAVIPASARAQYVGCCATPYQQYRQCYTTDCHENDMETLCREWGSGLNAYQAYTPCCNVLYPTLYLNLMCSDAPVAKQKTSTGPEKLFYVRGCSGMYALMSFPVRLMPPKVTVSKNRGLRGRASVGK